MEEKRAIYVTLEASLLFWEKPSKIIEKIGYQRNKYDWCVVKNILKENNTLIE